MTAKSGIRFGAIPKNAIHLCVDMQRMFDEGSPWGTPWLRRILPAVVRLCEPHTQRTCFTRFIPLRSPNDAPGAWRRYYDSNEEMTLNRIDPALVCLVAELRIFTPPARVVDKNVYSPWWCSSLPAMLAAEQVDSLVVSGGETDVCVLATVLGAIDLGYRVIVATDALCSSIDRTHDAIVDFYEERLSAQIETATVDEINDAWR